MAADDEETPPPYTMGAFTPSSAPGCRAPHFRLADGRSHYDAFGPGYTLLRFDPQLDVRPLLIAARARKLPLVVLDVGAGEIPPAYRHKLVMRRADQHAAWRGGVVPANAAGLVDILRAARI